MTEISRVQNLIREAFAEASYPGDDNLRGSNEGDEPFLLEEEFVGKNSWQSLDPNFIDQAPDGYSSALSFFSDDAFRFYIPAYLIADLENKLKFVDPVFYLCHGLDDVSSQEAINPRRYGTKTWFDNKKEKFSPFTKKQAIAIVAYLRFKAAEDEFARDTIEQAIANYWKAATE